MWGLRRGLVRAGPGCGASEGAGPGAWGRGQGRAPCPHSGLGWAFHLRELSEAPVGASYWEDRGLYVCRRWSEAFW